eukprot:gnl/Trimastix_PCT/1083.p1 GENE.gnl/Trimastix_PCT/1083~~gnl/Trimastix_PCT/1083.p1  ORF type:complete len:1148 (-),score=270.65 gnl/Trimastix_PCT/1083:33-3476(-)
MCETARGHRVWMTSASGWAHNRAGVGSGVSVPGDMTEQPDDTGTSHLIRNVHVEFPFVPYDCQLLYMERVIEALDTSANALLESPTGTGKTLSLLCAALAWHKYRKQENVREGHIGAPVPPLFYCSRTHSQLHQVARELKRTTYRPKMTCLGSRESYCIHPSVSRQRGRMQTALCRRLTQAGQCHYYNRLKNSKSLPPGLNEAFDVEDLLAYGRQNSVCPYFCARQLQSDAELVLLPYNYVVDAATRRRMGFSLEDAIVIFDEAHNMEHVACDAASFELSTLDLATAIAEIDSCVQALEQRGTTSDMISLEDLGILKSLILSLEGSIENLPLPHDGGGATSTAQQMFDLLKSINLSPDTYDVFRETVDKFTATLAELSDDAQRQASGAVQALCDSFRVLFTQKEDLRSAYRVHTFDRPRKDGRVRTMAYWCFSPAPAMKDLRDQGVRNIILTSGTLSPMDTYEVELGMSFPVRLENPHVIQGHQIWVGQVGLGPTGRLLNASYRTRSAPEYKEGLGSAIAEIARVVPDGLLVFFPSYGLMEMCLSAWERPLRPGQPAILERIRAAKRVVIEPKQSSVFAQCIKEYTDAIHRPLPSGPLAARSTCTGAIMFAVCRGKVAEGLDFADRNGRAVIIVGPPFPNAQDPKVKLKRTFCDETSKQTLSGAQWYQLQASRAVNQAVGRVIRHRHDFGAIILLDERFSNKQSELSRWLRPHALRYDDFQLCLRSLSKFFANLTLGTGNAPKAPALAPHRTRPSGFKLSSKSRFRIARPDSAPARPAGAGVGRSGRTTATESKALAPHVTIAGAPVAPTQTALQAKRVRSEALASFRTSAYALKRARGQASPKEDPPTEPPPASLPAPSGPSGPLPGAVSASLSVAQSSLSLSLSARLKRGRFRITQPPLAPAAHPTESSLPPSLVGRSLPAATAQLPSPAAHPCQPAECANSAWGASPPSSPDPQAPSRAQATPGTSSVGPASVPSAPTLSAATPTTTPTHKASESAPAPQPSAVPPTGHKKEQDSIAKAFLTKVKRTLAPPDYRLFTAMLQQFRAHRINLNELFAQSVQIFGTVPDADALLASFVVFLPRSKQDAFRKLAQAKMAQHVSPFDYNLVSGSAAAVKSRKRPHLHERFVTLPPATPPAPPAPLKKPP